MHEMLSLSSALETISPDDLYHSVHDAVVAFQKRLPNDETSNCDLSHDEASNNNVNGARNFARVSLRSSKSKNKKYVTLEEAYDKHVQNVPQDTNKKTAPPLRLANSDGSFDSPLSNILEDGAKAGSDNNV